MIGMVTIRRSDEVGRCGNGQGSRGRSEDQTCWFELVTVRGSYRLVGIHGDDQKIRWVA